MQNTLKYLGNILKTDIREEKLKIRIRAEDEKKKNDGNKWENKEMERMKEKLQ